MQSMTVLYDGACEICRRARTWLERQPKFVPLHFVPATSERARQLFPWLDPESTLADLTVIGDGGEVYRGAAAWVMCLWALREWREWSLTLASPDVMPKARQFITWVSRNRLAIGRLVAPTAQRAP